MVSVNESERIPLHPAGIDWRHHAIVFLYTDHGVRMI